MLHLLTQHRHIVLFVLFVLISLALLSFDRPITEMLPKPSNILERFLLVILQPFQRAVTAVINYGQQIWQNYIHLVHLSQENQQLREEIKRLRAEKNRYIEKALAYERLKGTLDMVKDRRFSTILARVIGYDPSNHSNTIIVNRGSEHGVKESWPVITQDGVVGVTVSVSQHSSKVLLLIDPNCNVAALIQRTRDQGIVGGKGKQDAYIMKYVNRRADIREGTVYRISEQSLVEIAKEDIPGYVITEHTLTSLQENFLPADILTILEVLKDQEYLNQKLFVRALETTIGKEQADWYKGIILQYAQAGILAKLQQLKEQQYSTEADFFQALNEAIGEENVGPYKTRILEHVQEEEVVISSGLGGIFPKGLILGTVTKVDKQDYGLFQEIEIAPGVNFSKLEEVLIIRRDDIAAAE